MIKTFVRVFQRSQKPNWLLSRSLITLAYNTGLTKVFNYLILMLKEEPTLYKIKQLLPTKMTTKSTTMQIM
jgi:hypothetical protein